MGVSRRLFGGCGDCGVNVGEEFGKNELGTTFGYLFNIFSIWSAVVRVVLTKLRLPVMFVEFSNWLLTFISFSQYLYVTSFFN